MKSKLISCLLFTTMLAAILIIPPKSRADAPNAYAFDTCLTINNLSQYPAYKVILLPTYPEKEIGHDYFDLVKLRPFQNNVCQQYDPVAIGLEFNGVTYFAIKSGDYNKLLAMANNYPQIVNNKWSYTKISAADANTIKAMLIPSSLLLFYDVTPKENDPTVQGASNVKTTATITGIGSSLNLFIISRTIIFKNGTTKTINYPLPTSTTKPKVTPTPIPKPALSLKSQTRLTSGKSQTITGTSSTIYPTDKLTLSGTTSANAKITLTIHSTPTTADITADASGNWTYTLDPKTLKLPLGSHTITAIATATNGAKSDEVTLATFTLKNPPTPITETTESPNYFTTTNIALFAGAILLLAALLFLLIKRHKQQPIDKI